MGAQGLGHTGRRLVGGWHPHLGTGALAVLCVRRSWDCMRLSAEGRGEVCWDLGCAGVDGGWVLLMACGL